MKQQDKLLRPVQDEAASCGIPDKEAVLRTANPDQAEAMVFETVRLRSLVAIVETGSFTTAEARVNLTQPAVSLHDTVDDREASALSDPKSSTRPQSSVSDLARNQNLVFPAILTLGKTVIKADGKDIPLSPGMAVTVEVLTGKRRALDCILSPLREVTSSSAHER